MRRRRDALTLLITFFMATVIGVACGSPGVETMVPTGEPPPTTALPVLPADVSPLHSPLPTPGPRPAGITLTSPLPQPPGGPRDPVARAIADLAERLGVERAAIQVVSVTDDEFPVQGLGCPLADKPSGLEKPDQPAFVMGQVIYLRVGDVEYEYHARGAQIAFCGQN